MWVHEWRILQTDIEDAIRGLVHRYTLVYTNTDEEGVTRIQGEPHRIMGESLTEAWTEANKVLEAFDKPVLKLEWETQELRGMR